MFHGVHSVYNNEESLLKVCSDSSVGRVTGCISTGEGLIHSKSLNSSLWPLLQNCFGLPYPVSNDGSTPNNKQLECRADHWFLLNSWVPEYVELYVHVITCWCAVAFTFHPSTVSYACCHFSVNVMLIIAMTMNTVLVRWCLVTSIFAPVNSSSLSSAFLN